MRRFEELIAEAGALDVAGWDFTGLQGRATEERPPWGYSRLVAERLAEVGSALDIDTGGGQILDEAPRLPVRTWRHRELATERGPGPSTARTARGRGARAPG